MAALSTRLHSSRKRTARVLTVSPSILCTGGVYLVPGGVSGPRGVCTWSRGGCTCSWGVYLVLGGVPGPGGCTCSWGVYWCQGGVPGAGGCTWSWGVSAPGGVPAPRGSWGVYLLPGGVPGPGGCTWSRGCQVLPPCEQNDKQVQKYYLAPNFVCGL